MRKVCVVSSRIVLPDIEPGPDCSNGNPTTTPDPEPSTEEPGGGGGCSGQITNRTQCVRPSWRPDVIKLKGRIVAPDYGGRLNQWFELDGSDGIGGIGNLVGGFLPGWCGVPSNYPLTGINANGAVLSGSGPFTFATEQVAVGADYFQHGHGSCGWKNGAARLHYIKTIPGGSGPPTSEFRAAAVDGVTVQVNCPDPPGTSVEINIFGTMINIPIKLGGRPDNPSYYDLLFYDYNGCPIFQMAGPFHFQISSTGG